MKRDVREYRCKMCGGKVKVISFTDMTCQECGVKNNVELVEVKR